MMKKNKLYTVNKFNRPMFMPEENLFKGGGNTGVKANVGGDAWNKAAFNKDPLGYMTSVAQGFDPVAAYKSSKNWLGLSKEDNPFSKGNLGTLFSKENVNGALKGGAESLASAGAGLVGSKVAGAISGGLTSKAGSVVGDVGSTVLGAAGTALAGPIGGAVGSFVGQTLGGVTNALFGEKVDAAKLGRVEGDIAKLNSFTSNAGSFDEIKGPEAVSMDTDVYSGGLFNDVSGKNEELKRRLIAAKSFADRSVDNNVLNLTSDQLNNALANYSAFGGPIDTSMDDAIGYSFMSDYLLSKNKTAENKTKMTNMFMGMPNSMFAFGGDMQTNSADFPTGLTHINAGGSHEENPNDGVQMGVDNKGIPNLVEEGETVYNDYVFSDRLIVPRGKRGNYGKRNKYAKGGKMEKGGKSEDMNYDEQVLKPFVGLTFAEAAKKAEKQSGVTDRPNDPIAQRGFEATLAILATQQEKEREKEKLAEMQEAIDNMTPEELAMLQQQMAANQQQADEQAMAQQQQMIPQGMEQMVPQEQMVAAYGGPIYGLGGILDNWDTNLNANIFARGGFEDWWTKYINDPVMVNTATDGTDNRIYNPDYGALYKAVTGTEGPTDSVAVYNALKELYVTNPEKFQPYDLRTNAFINATSTEIPTDIATEDTPKGTTTATEEVPTAEIKGPEVEAFNYYNSKHTDKPLTAEQWSKLSDKERNRYIKQYRSSLGSKDDRLNFDERLDAYNKQVAIDNRISEYRTQQRNSHLTADDIKGMSWEQLEKIASRVDPSYTSQDRSKMSQNEREAAETALRERIVQKSKDNNVTVGDINTSFAAPTMHRDWKPIDAEQAWLKTPNEYDWKNPLYGGQHDVVAGNTEGRYQSRDWTIQDGDNKGKIKVGDKLYDNMLKYETSDEYLLPRYELAKSAAALDEAGLKIWKDYVSTLDKNYASKYAPTTLFGENYADNLDNYEAFKNYITSNYDALNKAGSGFFDLKAGQMHGMMLPTKTRELYQMADNKGVYLTPEGDWLNYYTDVVTDDGQGTKLHTLSPNGAISITRANGLPEDISLNPDGSYKLKTDNDPFPKAPSWPYLAGVGLQAGSLAYNLLSPKDYSNADAMIKAALNAGTYNPIEFRPIGNYLTYRPLDIWYEQNRANALSRATDRNIMNTSGGNRGTAMAGLLANSYNSQLASGNLFRQAQEYNDALRKQVGEFNKDTDKFNSEGFLKADMSNQDAATRARGYRLEGLKSGYAMRQAIDDARANAINAGINGLANLAYAYALNKYNNDVLGWRMQKGVDGPGIYYKNPYLAKGGRINRKNKGLSF